MQELQDSLRDFTTTVPSDNLQIIEVFPNWVEKILQRNRRHRLVLIIDGLDNLDDRENALDLLWFPQHMTSSVRTFVSTIEGRCWNMLVRRGYESLTLKPLSEAEVCLYLFN